jgi:hypothetical protein
MDVIYNQTQNSSDVRTAPFNGATLCCDRFHCHSTNFRFKLLCHSHYERYNYNFCRQNYSFNWEKNHIHLHNWNSYFNTLFLNFIEMTADETIICKRSSIVITEVWTTENVVRIRSRQTNSNWHANNGLVLSTRQRGQLLLRLWQIRLRTRPAYFQHVWSNAVKNWFRQVL